MKTLKDKNVLVSGASIAGLATAWWMNKLGYRVTVVEIAAQPRTAGAAVDLRGEATIDIVKRMGIYGQLKAGRLQVETVEYKNAADVTEGNMSIDDNHDDIEIEREQFMAIVYEGLKTEVEFIFGDSIAALNDTGEDMLVAFKNGGQRAFDLVFGCDGIHSVVRRLWFGHEAEYSHFLQAYFSISIAGKLLIKQKTMQMYNEPDKAIMLNAYKNKTDIIFCFHSDTEIPYDYRDVAGQRQIILNKFAGSDWRTAELLDEVQQADNFYFDKFCQIKMPAWTKGRVALVGDAGYCASPAAGMGASLSIAGAAALADALEKHEGDFDLAFADYNQNLRPFIEEVQAAAELNVKENFIPRTDEAIRKRNTQRV